jgi:hypothetical protein
LLENLHFLSGLRRDGTVGQVFLYFAVQACNFRDMVSLAGLAAELGFDRVEFHPLRNAGSYQPEDFRARAVCDPDHPEFADLLRELRRLAMVGPVADLGGLRALIDDPASETGAPGANWISHREQP